MHDASLLKQVKVQNETWPIGAPFECRGKPKSDMQLQLKCNKHKFKRAIAYLEGWLVLKECQDSYFLEFVKCKKREDNKRLV